MRVAVIVPTYRNLRTLPTVLQELADAELSVIVIDDGSDDGTNEWARAWCDGHAQRTLITFTHNQGKGAALVAGLARARELGFGCALTMDSDGQHRIGDALKLLQSARSGVFLLGRRCEVTEGYPTASLFGRRLWALGIRALTGLGVSDPICGLRCYPLAQVEHIVCRGGRYAWEEEFLVRAAWAGVEIDELEIATVYQTGEQRVSHFRFGDWVESLTVFARLAATRVFVLTPSSALRGSLLRRDRSWRRIQGAAILVAGTLALCATQQFDVFVALAIVVPIVMWLGWRLHASVLVALCAAVIVALLSTIAPAWLSAIAVISLMLAFTRAARCLGSN